MTRKKKPKYGVVFCLIAALAFTGCSTVMYNPDGTVQKQTIDYGTVKLAAAASIALWAAASKNGLTQREVKAVETILGSLGEYTSHGLPIIAKDWLPIVQRDVPAKWQGLAIILVAILENEMNKAGINTVLTSVPEDAAKLIHAISEGASLGLAPYVGKGAA